MNLRLRLVLTTLAMAVPVLIAFGLATRTTVQQRDDDIVNTLVLARFSSAELDACEASPPATPVGITMPAPRPELLHPVGADDKLFVFTYDRTGRSTQLNAPALSDAVLVDVRRGALRAGNYVDMMVGKDRYLLMPLLRERGPCALVLAPALRMRPPLPPPHEVIVLIVFALFAGLVGIWPVVRRIRSMSLAVRRWEKGEPLGLQRDAGRDELSELSRALTDSAETILQQHVALVARQKALLEFIENTTHDLATPLTVLQGNLSAIAREHNLEDVRQAMKEAQYIGALLGNLAVSAKFEASAQVVASLNLCDVVSRVVDRHRAMGRWLGIEIERSTPEEQVLAPGDPTFTERALANLVENAMRHNHSGGHVAVVLDTEGSEFVLRVLDDGPGLTEEECERLQRWDGQIDTARSRSSEGRGLGLFIVARVAQLQNWRFELNPGEIGGLVAELRGPLA